MNRLLLILTTTLLLGVGAARAGNLVPADCLWYLGKFPQAVTLYRSAALQGDMVAQRRLGNIYATSLAFGQPDYREALRWYRLAAAQGDAEAQDALALMYRDGDGVPQNYAEALKWLRLAAASGYQLGQYHLGLMYSAGHGVAQDYLRAYMWLSVGVASNAVEIAAARQDIARYLTPQQIAEAQKLAEQCELRNFGDCD
jgi:TPR repeat protein